jgi:hypothetical protein
VGRVRSVDGRRTIVSLGRSIAWTLVRNTGIETETSNSLNELNDGVRLGLGERTECVLDALGPRQL